MCIRQTFSTGHPERANKGESKDLGAIKTIAPRCVCTNPIPALLAVHTTVLFKISLKKFAKPLDKHVVACYNTGAKKQNVPRSHPAAKERARLIGTLTLGVFCRAGRVLCAIFYFTGSIPGNGGNFLLALQKIC